MTRLLTLLLLASALLAGAVAAQPAPLPPDERFDEPVSFSTTREGEDLATMVSALARSVGLTPVVDDVPDEIVRYDIDEPTPFRQVWNLLLSLNDLDYVLQENDVVVVGPPESLASLRRTAPAPAEADGDVAPDSQVQRLYRVNGDPNDLAAIVSRLVPNADVDVLPGTSALVVLATEAGHAAVRDTLGEFDQPTRRYAVAGAGEEAREYLLTFVPEAEIEVAANALLVTATEDQHARVQEALDTYQPPDVAEAPEEGPETERRVYRVNGVPSQVNEIVTTLIPEVDTDVLGSAGALVVVGSEEQHLRVEEVLDEFDAPTRRVDLEQRIYALSNAQATELADVLQSTDFVVEEQQGGEEDGEQAGEEGDAEGGDGEEPSFTVVPDERTNSLIITATPAVQARLADLIPELDAPQRQVNVQVRIQEINRRVASNLGINLGAASGNFAANVLSSGLQFVFDPQSAVSGLNIGAVLDTLENQGLSRRVDDSTLTVLNNGSGRMQSGGRIEISFPSDGGDLATRTIEFGVIIEVAPRVAEDGRVILDVSAEVSDVLVPINEGGIPERIDFSTRQVSSTVTLRPGQTVLLGGLLQNSFSRTEGRVPILGRIPVLGALFGTTEVEDENSELMLIVNAQVID